jgi:hypothetical protein
MTATLGSFYWLGFETSGLSPDKKRLAWLGAQRFMWWQPGYWNVIEKSTVECYRLVTHALFAMLYLGDAVSKGHRKFFIFLNPSGQFQGSGLA